MQILRVPWFNDSIEGHFRARDPDLIARLTERDPLEASAQLALDLRPAPCRERHWTEELAAALSEETTLALQGWAAERGIRPDAISHGFHRAFGVSPKLFRLEVRSRRAWGAVIGSTRSLTRIAHEAGFSDLPHMSRSIRAFTGFAPKVWRTWMRQTVAGVSYCLT